MSYLKTTSDQLRGDFRQKQPSTASTSHSTSEVIRLNGKLHVILMGQKKDCKVCSQRTSGQRRQTVYYSDTCPDKPRMHIGDCFIKYHKK
ncbi:hypothetical protein X975_25777, partial [Stegodyphus mimosarum]